MADQQKTIRMDKDLRPAYYDEFHCLAADCRLSCCKGWTITFNKKDYLSLKREKGSPELNAMMEGAVRRIRKGPAAETFYGEFNMDSGVCPLLREDCLCQLQRENGHEALPHVCRSYPRAEAYMLSGYLERSLSPSCEGVLALMWNLPDGIEFRSDPLPKEERRTMVFSEEEPLSKWFSVVREWCVDLLQNRKYALPERIWLMGLGLKELADGETDVWHWLERASVLTRSADVSCVLPSGDRELVMFISDCIRTLLTLRTSDPDLRLVKDQLMEALKLDTHGGTGGFTFSPALYREARTAYEERYGNRDYFMENLMVSIFFHLRMPHMASGEALWKSYVNFCNLYAMYRFLAVLSCQKGSAGDRAELFRMLVFASRALIHNGTRRDQLRDELFQNDSATLPHMAILLCG